MSLSAHYGADERKERPYKWADDWLWMCLLWYACVSSVRSKHVTMINKYKRIYRVMLLIVQDANEEIKNSAYLATQTDLYEQTGTEI